MGSSTKSKTKSGIVSWDHSIRIDGTPRGDLAPVYTKIVGQLLNTIGKQDSGWLVLDAIRGSGRTLTIRATTPLLESIESNPGNAHPYKPGKTHCAKAADSELEFVPAPWIDSTKLDPTGQYRSDDVLVHELVHEARQMRGVFCKRRMRDGWDNTEEFLAILIANIYRSEKDASNKLRADHQPVWKTLTMSDYDFWMRYAQEIYSLKNDMNRLFTGLSQVRSEWNPIRVEVEQTRAMLGK